MLHPRRLLQDSVDGHRLDTLRVGGWYGPELEPLGFRLRSAEGITVGGRPTLELTLENDGVTATAYERRKVGGPEPEPAGPPVGAVTERPVTGRPVTTDGFEFLGGAGRDLSGAVGRTVAGGPRLPGSHLHRCLRHARGSHAPDPQSARDHRARAVVRGSPGPARFPDAADRARVLTDRASEGSVPVSIRDEGDRPGPGR